MIDIILRYDNRAAAIADLSPYVGIGDDNTPDFLRDRILPNVQVWRASQDVSGAHNYMAGYFVLVSLPYVIPALRDNPALQLAVDRDKANARQSGAIIKSTISAAVLQDLRFQPVFAGCDYPWAAWG